ncbi:DUF4145 domain-containing protein [Agromyces sp. NPDC060279]|uniref:DUF4145 domain-containing protein n=1 Tax=Agromyces sp. NPDC060279 TaxID=3347092 RepID=UPI003664D235
MAAQEDAGSDSRFVCPRCRAFSFHARGPLNLRAIVSGRGQVFVPFVDLPGYFRVDGTDIYSTKQAGQWSATVCTACDAPSVWRGETLVHPADSTAPAPHPDMPEPVRELYGEASLVLPYSRRAAAALARASLEALLRELEESGSRKNLQTRIGELQDKINPALWKVLTALRVVGNDALHGDQDDLVVLYLSGEPAEVVEPFFGAINQLVEELITQPRKAEELYALIPDAKREAAERSGK